MKIVITKTIQTIKTFLNKRLLKYLLEAFFKAVNVCQTGRGIVWDTERDLAASEIWINGK